ncbi:MAG TPA: YitT family protein [Clostridiaceae bacterium]
MKKFKEYLFITIGFMLVALSVELFMAPNQLAPGGVSGIAIIMNGIFPQLPIGMMMLFMNIVLFIVAFLAIGSRFGAKTIYASIGLSGSIWILDKFMSEKYVITHNLLLACFFGTLLSGIGMGLVFNRNASTGGTDILAKMTNKILPIGIGKCLLAVDFIITIFSAAVFGADKGLFSLLCVILNGFVIDNVIAGLNVCKQVIVISRKSDLIKEYIFKVLDRSCTELISRGGYSGTEYNTIYIVLNRKEFIKLKNFIKDIDKEAFITVSEAHEVLGRGFKEINEED